MDKLAPTLQIVSLRRLAEAEAQASLRSARGELQLGHRQLERLRRNLAAAKQALTAARAAQLAGQLPAALLDREAAALARKAQAGRSGQRAVEDAQGELERLVREHEQARTRLLACVAKREAAELHEALERREQRRLRGQRERAHDDEARDRFALRRVK